MSPFSAVKETRPLEKALLAIIKVSNLHILLVSEMKNMRVIRKVVV